MRQVRRDANERLKKLLKDHQISEDDEKKGLDEVQKITDQHIKQIDEVQKKKDQDLLGNIGRSDVQISKYNVGFCNFTMSFFTTSNAPCRAERHCSIHAAVTRHHLCSCGAPLLARYDLEQARAWSRDTLPYLVRRRCGAIGSSCRCSTARNR